MQFINRVWIIAVAFVVGVPVLLPAQNAALDKKNLTTYVPVELKSNLDHLTDNQKQLLRLLISAAQDMDDVFWLQAYGDKQSLLDSISDPVLKQHAIVNYGPWDRLQDNQPFISGFPTKPAGANLYPRDVTKDEFEKHLAEHPEDAQSLKSLYTIVVRDAAGGLTAIPYSEAFEVQFKRAAEELMKASELAKDGGFKAYLQARSKALLTDDYRSSDML